jgi:3D (Asp-Asp-Asp) domain-containing protein
MNAIFSFYCACAICCGQWADGITASGRRPVEGVTIAGPRSVPLGTMVKVSVPGWWTNTFRVDDRMARKWDGKRWDVYVGDHEKAKRLGVMNGKVEVIR